VTTGSKAVFLSYASQDAEAARRIADTFRSAGIEVWFDQSELRGGEAWDRQIRKQIHDCALFIPVISATTQGRLEGYFRREWRLAVDRTHDMADGKPFLVPVVIDDTKDPDAEVPDAFRAVQWSRLPAGQTPPALVERVCRLLSPQGPVSPALARPPGGPAPAPQPSAPGPAAPRQTQSALLLIGAIAVIAAGYFALDKLWLSKRGAAGTPPSSMTGQAGAFAPGAIPEKSIAVLPFADMSEKKDQEYFSDGLAEELIDVLTKVPNLRVPARTSSFSFKGRQITIGEIAHALGVTHVLEGSVRKAGGHMRITAQLVRADNGFHLWSQTYDREVRDIFAVQDDIAHAVAEQLRITLLVPGAAAAKQTTSTEAHNRYLQARYLADRDTPADLDQAVALYQQALKLDPNYALAWAWLAYCHVRRVAQGLDTTGAGFTQATAAAQRAIELDPSLPEGYTSLASAHMQFDRDWAAGAEALRKATALDPNNTLVQQMSGHLAAGIGKMSDAIAHFRRAADSDPLNMLPRKYLGRALHYGGQSAEAAAELRDAIGFNARFPGLHYELGRALLLLGQPAAASAAFEGETDASWRRIGLPLGYFATHRQKEAQAALAALVAESAGSEFQVAEAYAYSGQTDKSFEWLDRARTLHDPGIIWTRRDPLLASIAGDPRFDAFLESVHMPAVQNNPGE
jgi:TolB-like protein/tetratricopeptide (TPR) repeat protein